MQVSHYVYMCHEQQKHQSQKSVLLIQLQLHWAHALYQLKVLVYGIIL